MKLGIMQPYFFPYLGYFQLMHAVDRWIAFDDVQFIDKGWINRNRILHPQPEKGWQFITVPLRKRGQFARINDVEINEQQRWRDNLLGKLSAYRKAPGYHQTMALVEDCFAIEEHRLSVFVIQVLRKVAAHLAITTPITVQSEMDLTLGEVNHAGQWALRISEAVGATEYINPSHGRDLFRPTEWQEAGIQLSLLETTLSPYPQGGRDFVAGLSIIDVLMWCSVEEVAAMLVRDHRIVRHTEEDNG